MAINEEAMRNLFVMHEGSRYTSEGRWLTAFTLATPHLWEKINVIEAQVTQIGSYLGHFEKIDTSSVNIQHMIIERRHHLNSMVKHVNRLKILVQEVDGLSISEKRIQKRSLIPFLGNLLSDLTGVATEKDVQFINKKLRDLAQSDVDLTHIIQDSVTIVNATQLKVNELTGTVNSLLDGLKSVEQACVNLTQWVSSNLDQQNQVSVGFASLANFMQVLQSNILQVEREVDTLRLAIGDVLRHQVTLNVLSPGDLKHMLIEIEAQIGNVYMLPFDIEENLMGYYKELACDSYKSKRGLGVVISLPLLSVSSKVDIYQLKAIPIPFKGTGSINYQLDHNFLAISKDKTKVAYLSSLEFMKCSKEDSIFCHISSPFRFVSNEEKVCSVALSLRGSVKYCPVEISFSTLVVPQVIYLNSGRHIVVTNRSEEFLVMCPNEPSFIKVINPPTGSLNLPLGCKAQSHTVSIAPVYYRKERTISTHRDVLHNCTLEMFESVPKDLNLSLSKLPPKIKETLPDTMTLDKLKMHIKAHLHKAELLRVSKRNQINILVPCVLGGLVFIIVACLFCKCFGRGGLKTLAKGGRNLAVETDDPEEPNVEKKREVVGQLQDRSIASGVQAEAMVQEEQVAPPDEFPAAGVPGVTEVKYKMLARENMSN